MILPVGYVAPASTSAHPHDVGDSTDGKAGKRQPCVKATSQSLGMRARLPADRKHLADCSPFGANCQFLRLCKEWDASLPGPVPTGGVICYWAYSSAMYHGSNTSCAAAATVRSLPAKSLTAARSVHEDMGSTPGLSIFNRTAPTSGLHPSSHCLLTNFRAL